MSLSPELSAAILWTTKGLLCLYIILIVVLDVEQWGYILNNEASKIAFVGFVITSFFADTSLFLLASVAFILTLVRLESKSEKKSEKFDVLDSEIPKGFEYVESKTKEVFSAPTPTAAPTAVPPTPTPTATLSQPTPTATLSQPTLPPTAQPGTTSLPFTVITASTLVARKKSDEGNAADLEDPAERAIQKYAIDSSLEKAGSDGIIKNNYNKFMHPLGKNQYNIQGITETMVGYNYDKSL